MYLISYLANLDALAFMEGAFPAPEGVFSENLIFNGGATGGRGCVNGRLEHSTDDKDESCTANSGDSSKEL